MKTLKVLGAAAVIGWGLNALMSTDSYSADAQKSLVEAQKTVSDIPNHDLPTQIVRKVEKNVQHWFHHYEHDDMNGTDQEYTTNSSLNKKTFDFPYNHGAYLSINYRSYPFMAKGEHKPTNVKVKDVYLYTTDGQIDCNSFDGCYVKVRFDEGKVERFQVSYAAHGRHDVVFLSNPKKFVNEVKNHKKAIIEVPFWQYGGQQFKFDLKDEHSVTYSS